MKAEQINLNFEETQEKSKESKWDREEREAIEKSIEDCLLSKKGRKDEKNKIRFPFLHLVLVGSMKYYQNSVLSSNETDALAPTPQMRDKEILRVLNKIWSTLEPMLKEKDWPYDKKGIEEHIKEKPEETWRSIEDSLPKHDR